MAKRIASDKKDRKTIFRQYGYQDTIANLVQQTKDLYLADDIPWVVGYSGGKDSTATLQIVWKALSELPKKKQHKTVHVISTDTLVENPIVALWVEKALDLLNEAAAEQDLPIKAHRLTPEVKDRFWVNLIGKGYPAPRPKFRWCTSRLKIAPSNKFISEIVNKSGEAILVLGTRKAESSDRAANMKKYEQGSTRSLLNKNKELDRVWVYTPISEWQNDDVWQFLHQDKNSWGVSNKHLQAMYSDATEDGECPIVVDTSTPSCGDSRFGCFVCTLVGEDKSMTAMIMNDAEKEWMLPLLELRTKWLDITDPNLEQKNKKIDLERDLREFRRMNGSLTLHNDRLVHGPYKQSYRAQLLEAVLKAERIARQNAPKAIKDLQLISLEEIQEIRRIWVIEKHEIEDLVPKIYGNIAGKSYPGSELDMSHTFKTGDMQLLFDICKEEFGDEEVANSHYELIRNLIHVEYQYRTMVRRSKLFTQLGSVLQKYVFDSEKEALSFALAKKNSSDQINDYLENEPLEDNMLFKDAMGS